MLPNPFEKPLPKLEDTDPLKNEEIVRSLLGEGGVHKYRKILGDNRTEQRKSVDTSFEELKALAAEAIAKKDSLSHEGFALSFEKNIEKKYAAQIKSLQEISFLETKDGKLGLTAIDNKFYEVPSAEAITKHFLSIPNIKQKIDQGFTRLLIVPFGTSLDSLREKTKKVLLKHVMENKLLREDGSELELDIRTPLFTVTGFDEIDTKHDLLYYPNSLSLGDNGGRTKNELLEEPDVVSPFPGFHILLFQEDLQIPDTEQGKTKGGRQQLEAGQSPNNYLSILQTNPLYTHERGLTPEDWLTLLTTNLNQYNRVINDWRSGTDKCSFLIGSYLPKYRLVPSADWGEGQAQAVIEMYGFFEKNEYRGVTTAVS